MSIFSKIRLNSLPANLSLKPLAKNNIPKPKTNILKEAINSDILQKNPQILEENIYYKKLTPEELKKYGNNKQFPPDGYCPTPKDPTNPPPPPPSGASSAIPLKDQAKPRKFTYYPPIEIRPKKYSDPIVEIPLPLKRSQKH